MKPENLPGKIVLKDFSQSYYAFLAITFVFTLGITLLPSSLIAGVLYDNVNSGAPFYFGSAMALLAACMMFVFYRRRLSSGSIYA